MEKLAKFCAQSFCPKRRKKKVNFQGNLLATVSHKCNSRWRQTTVSENMSFPRKVPNSSGASCAQNTLLAEVKPNPVTAHCLVNSSRWNLLLSVCWPSVPALLSWWGWFQSRAICPAQVSSQYRFSERKQGWYSRVLEQASPIFFFFFFF